MNRLIIIAFTAGLLSSFLGGTLGIMAASTFQDTERTEAVFVYGTLMNPITRAYACVCWTGLRPETLDGYVKTLRNIVPAENSRVRGGVITVTPTELARIDRYEGVPNEYRRERIMVGVQEMWVYLKNEGH